MYVESSKQKASSWPLSNDYYFDSIFINLPNIVKKPREQHFGLTGFQNFSSWKSRTAIILPFLVSSFPYYKTRKLFFRLISLPNIIANNSFLSPHFSAQRGVYCMSIVTNPFFCECRVQCPCGERSALSAVISLLKAFGCGKLCAARRVLLTWDIRRYMHTAPSPEASSADLLLQQTTTSSLSTANQTNQRSNWDSARAHYIHRECIFLFTLMVCALGKKRRHKVNVWSAPNIQLSLLTQALQ